MRAQSKQDHRNRDVVDGRYELRRKIKVGGFGSVYIAHSLQGDATKCAVKIMPKKYDRYAKIQNDIYDLIKAKKFTLGFIKHYDYGIHSSDLFLAMQLIGYDLEQILAKTKSKKFSIKSVLMIGLQTIDRIEALHTIGYVHRDIKPDNLAVGNKEKNNIIYLFDFGLAIKATATQPADEKGKMIGTLGYMSVRSHECKKANFYDDIESFVYTLVYLALGGLPWMKINLQTVADYQRIKAMKQKLDKDWFRKNNLPSELHDILELARNGNEKVGIDYLHIKYKLMAALHILKQQNDFNFDWCGVLRVTYDNEDSPRKRVEENRKINEMNKSNQKIVQNQIYEIYKFMENEEGIEKKENRTTKKSKEKSPNKQKQVEEEKLRLISKKVQQQNRKEKQKPRRPASTRDGQYRKKQENEGNKYNQIQEMLKQKTVAYSGPRIVINRTANHKI